MFSNSRTVAVSKTNRKEAKSLTASGRDKIANHHSFLPGR